MELRLKLVVLSTCAVLQLRTKNHMTEVVFASPVLMGIISFAIHALQSSAVRGTGVGKGRAPFLESRASRPSPAAQEVTILLSSPVRDKSAQPPFLGPVGVAAFFSGSSLIFNFFLSPSKTLFTLASTSGLLECPWQSTGRYGAEMMTRSWAMICLLCQRTGILLWEKCQRQSCRSRRVGLLCLTSSSKHHISTVLPH